MGLDPVLLPFFPCWAGGSAMIAGKLVLFPDPWSSKIRRSKRKEKLQDLSFEIEEGLLL
jgi:hypothetical protein